MTAVMSHSLKVVSIAAVCWAWTRRWAMRKRIGDMRSRLAPIDEVAGAWGALPLWAKGLLAPGNPAYGRARGPVLILIST